MSQLHPNYIKAQRLMIFLLIAGFIYFFLSDTYFNVSIQYKIVIPVMLLLVGGLHAYLLGKGYWWMKYVMLILFLSSFAKPSAWTNLANLDAIGFMATAFRLGINVWILWLLFKVPTVTLSNQKGPDISEPL